MGGYVCVHVRVCVCVCGFCGCVDGNGSETCVEGTLCSASGSPGSVLRDMSLAHCLACSALLLMGTAALYRVCSTGLR